MSFQEKRTLMSIITGIIIFAAYFVYALGKYRSGEFAPDDYRIWAIAMLKFIGLGAIIAIISQIIFHILLSIGIAVKEKIKDRTCDDKEIERTINSEIVEDERDKLIAMKSRQAGFMVSGFGFVAGLIALVIGYSPLVLMHLVFGFFSVGTITEGAIQLYFYRVGVRNA